MGIDAEMYAVTKQKLSEKDLIKLSYEAGLTFGADKFLRDEEGWSCKEGGKTIKIPSHHNISEVKKIEEDGPDWRAPPGHHIYHVHVCTRYYGPGYERGDFPFLFMLACWLECKLPGCQIRYGGDSSGVLSQPWGPKERQKFLEHFASDHSRDYFTSRNPFMEERGKSPTCDFCAGVPLTQVMFGGGIGNLRGGFVCHGCGRRVGRDEQGKFFECDPHDEGLEWAPKKES